MDRETLKGLNDIIEKSYNKRSIYSNIRINHMRVIYKKDETIIELPNQISLDVDLILKINQYFKSECSFYGKEITVIPNVIK